MSESSTPRPAAQAVAPTGQDQPDQGGDAAEPHAEALDARSVAGQNIASDLSRQGAERGAGLGAGGAGNRDARSPAQSDGEVPEDDMD